MTIEADTPVIQTYDLKKRYRKTPAVDGISFEVESGQVFGFLGPNGAGKTTTIGLLLGIITPTEGSFRLFGGETAADLHSARQRIGATLEHPNFYPYLSGRDNLRIVAGVKGETRNEIDRVLDVVGLGRRAKGKFKTYSLGMKQRLALAATMLGDPELIILDEPANGLDPEGMREIREIIRELGQRGKTIFLSSHLLSEVERTCTHVAIIQQGRIVKQDSIVDVTSHGVAGLRSADLNGLESAVAEYPAARWSRRRGDRVVAELDDGDLGALNAWLAGRGIHVSHLSLEARTLEDAFMEATGATETTEAGEAPTGRAGTDGRSEHRMGEVP
jgi:ABC-2 type transport system ATP-binding protein